MKSLTVTRYVRPLREGGSLPAIVEASDDGLYVAKFRGAGQGKKALLAEIICGGVGKALGLPVPEVVLLELDPKFGRNEPHDEIRDLLNASAGLNVGLDYLPGSITFDPLVRGALTDELAAKIVAFDSLTMNVDRTAKNPNLLSWHKNVWLIDHGAALYFHHGWGNPEEAARSPFAPIRQHVLLPFAKDVEAVRFKLSAQQLDEVLAPIPDEWLENEPGFATPADVRAAYKRFFEVRLANQALFLEEASRARAQLV